MRRERRGHRETKRWKADPKNETQPVMTCRSQPKIILLFITQTTEVRNNQCMCIHSYEHNNNNKKSEENHILTYTGHFWLFEQANCRIYCTGSKSKQKNNEKGNKTSPSCIVNSYGLCCWALNSPISTHRGWC